MKKVLLGGVGSYQFLRYPQPPLKCPLLLARLIDEVSRLAGGAEWTGSLNVRRIEHIEAKDSI